MTQVAPRLLVTPEEYAVRGTSIVRRVHTSRVACARDNILRQSVPNFGALSGVSARMRLLLGTLAHTLVELTTATLPTAHEICHGKCSQQEKCAGGWLSVTEAY